MSKLIEQEMSPSPYRGNQRMLQRYDDIDDVFRMITIPQQPSVREDHLAPNLIARLTRPTEKKEQGTNLLFRNDNGFFADMRVNSDSAAYPVSIDIFHPVATADRTDPSPLRMSIFHGQYDYKGDLTYFTLSPFAPLETSHTTEEAITKCKRHMSDELLRMSKGILLRSGPPVLGALERVSQKGFLGADVEEGERDPIKAALWEDRILTLLYSNDENQKEAARHFFTVSGFHDTLESLTSMPIYEGDEPLPQEYSSIPGSDDNLIHELSQHLFFRAELWAKQHTWECQLSSTGVSYTIGSAVFSEKPATEVAYGSKEINPIPPSETDSPLSFGFQLLKHEDKAKQDKLYIAMYINGTFMYRLAVRTHVDPKDLYTVMTNPTAAFAEYTGFAEYSLFHLHNVTRR